MHKWLGIIIGVLLVEGSCSFSQNEIKVLPNETTKVEARLIDAQCELLPDDIFIDSNKLYTISAIREHGNYLGTVVSLYEESKQPRIIYETSSMYIGRTSIGDMFFVGEEQEGMALRKVGVDGMEKFENVYPKYSSAYVLDANSSENSIIAFEYEPAKIDVKVLDQLGSEKQGVQISQGSVSAKLANDGYFYYNKMNRQPKSQILEYRNNSGSTVWSKILPNNLVMAPNIEVLGNRVWVSVIDDSDTRGFYCFEKETGKFVQSSMLSDEDFEDVRLFYCLGTYDDSWIFFCKTSSPINDTAVYSILKINNENITSTVIDPALMPNDIEKMAWATMNNDGTIHIAIGSDSEKSMISWYQCHV